jgi:hypothetical protein
MAFDAKSLATDIVAEVAATQKVSASKGAAPLTAVGPNDFCNIWPKAKPVLELVSGVIGFIPGAGSTAGAVLLGLIKVGDQIAGQLCK